MQAAVKIQNDGKTPWKPYVMFNGPIEIYDVYLIVLKPIWKWIQSSFMFKIFLKAYHTFEHMRVSLYNLYTNGDNQVNRKQILHTRVGIN